MKCKLAIKYCGSMIITLVLFYLVINDALNFSHMAYLNIYNHGSFLTSFCLGYIFSRVYLKSSPDANKLLNKSESPENATAKINQYSIIKYAIFVVPVVWVLLSIVFICFGISMLNLNLGDVQYLTALQLFAGLLVYVFVGFLFGFTIRLEQ